MDFSSWTTKKEEVVHSNPFFKIGRNQFITAQADEGQWYYHFGHNAVMVVGQLSDDEFVTIREYRYLHDKVNTGFVAGGIDQNETPEHAALREFKEEAGYDAHDLIFLGTMATGPAISKELFYVYLAQDLSPTERDIGTFEKIEPVILSRAQIEEVISTGQMWDSNAIASWHLTKSFIDQE